MLRGCPVCVMCNSYSIHFCIFKLCIMIVHTLKMCTFYFVHISFFSNFLWVLNLDIFSIINAKGVPSLCNLKLQQCSILYIQTLYNDCSHIEDVHLLFCECFLIFLTFLTVVELRSFFPSEMLRGCLVCVICISESIHYFIFKLCMMIVHTLKMCTSHFVHI